MPQNPVHNDGEVPWGTPVLSITNPGGGSAVDYVCDDFNINRPTKKTERTDENDEPNGKVIKRGFVTGTATVQIETAATALPKQGGTFAVDGENFVISDVDEPRDKEYRKVSFTFDKVYNAS